MILIDTGPLVALCDKKDSLHSTARQQLKLLVKNPLAVCEPVLAEACFLLRAPSQRERLRVTLDGLHVSSVLTDHVATMRQDIFEWMLKYQDHEPDWADATLAVLCGHDRRLKVWTFDKEFRTTWRTLAGSPIPLAIRTQVNFPV